MAYLDRELRYELINGRYPNLFWYRNMDMIGHLIRKHNIPPVDQNYFGDFSQETISEVAVSQRGKESFKKLPEEFWPRPYPGGIRIPHLHFKGNLYILNEEQWKDLTSLVVKDFTTKLKNVNNISFDKMMELSSAIDTL